MQAEEIYEWLLPDIFPYFPGEAINIDPKKSVIAQQGNRPVAILSVTRWVSWRIYAIAPYTVLGGAVQCRDVSFPTEEQVRRLKENKILS